MDKGKKGFSPSLLDTCLAAGDALGASCPHPFHSGLPLVPGLALCPFLEISVTHVASPVTSKCIYSVTQQMYIKHLTLCHVLEARRR